MRNILSQALFRPRGNPSARMFGPAGIAAIVSMSVVACSAAHALSVVEPPAAPALGSLTLRVQSTDPLEPRYFVQVSDSQVVAVEKNTHDIWMFTVGAKPSRRLLTTLSLPPRDAILSLGADGDRIGVLDSRGLLHTIDVTSGRHLDSLTVRTAKGARAIGIHSDRPGRWLVLEEQVTRDTYTGMPFDSLLVVAVERGRSPSVQWAEEKVGLSAPNGLLTDYTSLTGRADTLWIANASPPRMVRLVTSGRDSAPNRRFTLRQSPTRLLSKVEREHVRTLVRRSRLAPEVAEVLTSYPAVARLWPVPGGYVALGGTGSSTFAVDHYCDATYRRTLLAGPDVVDVAWLETVVVVRRADPAATKFRLDFYSPRQLIASCDSGPAAP